ncbi:MAG: ubiquinol-cytochrome c reductase iron-sulfur subunit, partial [Desulfobacterales bacterium]|nr:ubiquinol-cytochrome c reductase iron-sulfur subunit [Desulfobacterales bacterium]
APALRGSASQWVAAGGLDDFNPGKVTTVYLHYEVQDGFYHSRKVAPVLVSRSPDGRRMVVFSSNCTHLGCTVRWDEDKQLFLCACHGGAFAPDGTVKSGPPPRPLDRRAYKIADGALLVEVA